MDLAEQLKKLFASNFSAYVLSHGAHQVVQGASFYEYHKLFQKIYEFLQDEIDSQGELIRQIDEIPPFSLKRISELSDVTDVEAAPDTKGLIEAVDAALYTLIDLANDAFDKSAEDKEYGINNYLGGYIQQLDKFCWFLRVSTLADTPAK